MPENSPRFYEFGEFKIDVRRRILKKAAEQIAISAKNFDLLLFMIQNEGRILTHDELLDNVWEGTFVEQSNLKKGISALRHILGETPESSNYIKTIPRKGYSFVSSVRSFADEKPIENLHVSATQIVIEEEIIEEDEPHISIKPVAVPQLAGKSQNTWQRFSLPFFGILLALAIAGFVYWYFFNNPKSTQFSALRLENLKPQRLSTNGNVVEIAISTDAKFFVYVLRESNESQSLWLRRLGSMNAIPLVPSSNKVFTSMKVSPDNDFVYYTINENSRNVLYQVPILGGSPRKILENIYSYITFSPDGKKFAFVRNKPQTGRGLIVFDTESSTESEVYQVTGDLHLLIEPRWSPDGQRFAFIVSEKTSDGRIWGINEVSVNGGASRNIIKPQKGKIYALDWLSDNSGLLMTSDLNDIRQSQIFRVSYPNGEISRLTNDLLDYFSVCASKDGKSVLALQEERRSDIWSADINNFANTEQITQNLHLPGRFAVLPDGSFLAELVENSVQSLSLISSTGSNPRSFVQQISTDRFPGISADGKTILFISRRSGSDQIWRSDISGNNLQKLTEENTFIANPYLSPDGQSIYFERYNGARWQVVKMPKDGGEVEIISNETSNNFDFSPDGKLLAFGSFDDSTRKWKITVRNLADNSLVKVFDVSNGSFLRFTPDSQAIIFNTSDIIREGGNLFLQPLDGTPAKPLITLKDEKIYWADYSPDGKKLFFTRGKVSSSAVLLSLESPK